MGHNSKKRCHGWNSRKKNSEGTDQVFLEILCIIIFFFFLSFHSLHFLSARLRVQ